METDKLSPGVDDGLLPQGSYNKEDDDCDLQDASDIKCGISKCKPQCLQGCANIRAYTVSISLSLLFVISGLTYYVGTVRTIEKRFGLSSTEANITMTITDILATIMGLVVGYAGRTVHKPRFIGIGMILVSLGIMFYAVPFFLYGTMEDEYQKQLLNSVGTNSSTNGYEMYLCESGIDGVSESIDECQDGEAKFSMASQKRGALVCMILGGSFIGLGMPTLGTLGLPYIDENTNPGNSALYVGITTSMFAWSPIIGFMLAALCTKLPESVTGTSSLSPNSPQWIGAWWLGFIVMGLCNFIVGIPMLLFPKHLEHYYIENNKKKKKKKKPLSSAKFGAYIKEFPKVTWKLISNLPFLTLILSKICSMYVMSGIFMQLPRYMEIHFKQPAYVSNIISATTGAVVGAVGNILGGLLMKKLNMGVVAAARLYVFAVAVGVATLTIALFLGCPHLTLAGEIDQNNKLDVDMTCNAGCGCSRSRLEPVCVNNSINFISACHAGCRQHDKDNLTFHDCECSPHDTKVTTGLCQTESCNMLIPYIVVFLIGSFLSSIGRVPATMLLFRLVGKNDKSFAIGIFSCAVNLLCFIPSPILFGQLFDSTCILWQRKCGQRGACLLYDISMFRYYMHGITLVFKVGSLLLGIVCLILVTKQEKAIEEKAKQTEENNREVGSKGI